MIKQTVLATVMLTSMAVMAHAEPFTMESRRIPAGCTQDVAGFEKHILDEYGETLFRTYIDEASDHSVRVYANGDLDSISVMHYYQRYNWLCSILGATKIEEE